MQGVLLHGGDHEAAVRRPGHVDMRALPVQHVRRGLGVGKPEADAVVVAHARAGSPSARSTRPCGVEGASSVLSAALVVARRHGLAGRPRHRAGGARPPARRSSGPSRRRASRPAPSGPVVRRPARRRRPSRGVAVARRGQDAGARMRVDALRSRPRLDEQDRPVGQRQRGGLLQKGAATTCAPAGCSTTNWVRLVMAGGAEDMRLS